MRCAFVHGGGCTSCRGTDLWSGSV
uniref:Nonspecific lipid transfer protein n=1 Tax=Capsicum annuum TaxID=4072 RepID=Q6RUQ8_CAPAN|nr:nonspecific lipid transfer protein precursor [Capsicum annuum]